MTAEGVFTEFDAEMARVEAVALWFRSRNDTSPALNLSQARSVLRAADAAGIAELDVIRAKDRRLMAALLLLDELVDTLVPHAREDGAEGYDGLLKPEAAELVGEALRDARQYARMEGGVMS